MTGPSVDPVPATPVDRARKISLSPKKLLLGKWTAVSPAEREKHFLVTRVVEPDTLGAGIEWVEIEAVHSRRVSVLRWRDLTDASRWRQGWT